MEAPERADTPPADVQALVDGFHDLYYTSGERTWHTTTWLGHAALKCPLDLWVYQEIIFRTRPSLIVESGTARGGSALFMATICDLVEQGRVISIDTRDLSPPPHPRITYVSGSSTDPAIVERVTREAEGERAMVVLDSDHSRDHVLEELRCYAPLVGAETYLIVEDTNVNGHPVAPNFGPGPTEAIDEFLASETGREFVVDRGPEKSFLTFNPGGFLRRRQTQE